MHFNNITWQMLEGLHFCLVFLLYKISSIQLMHSFCSDKIHGGRRKHMHDTKHIVAYLHS